MTEQGQQLRERISRALSSQAGRTITVLSSLIAVQDELGYLPEEAIEDVAHFTDTTINDVWGVATFYTEFRFTPPAEHSIEVCWGPSCHLLGAMELMKKLQEGLGLTEEGDAKDSGISFRYNTCLGACALAPVISVDHQVIGRVTPEQAIALLARLNGKTSIGENR